MICPLWHASPTLFVDPKFITIIQLIFDFSYRKWIFLFDLVKLKWTAHMNKWDQTLSIVLILDCWLLVHNCILFTVDCYDCWFVDVKYWLSIVNCWSSIEDSWLLIVHCWLLMVDDRSKIWIPTLSICRNYFLIGGAAANTDTASLNSYIWKKSVTA